MLAVNLPKLPTTDVLKLGGEWHCPARLGYPDGEGGAHLTATVMRASKMLHWSGPQKPWLAGGHWREFWLPAQVFFYENLFATWSPPTDGTPPAWPRQQIGNHATDPSQRPVLLVTVTSGFMDFCVNWLVWAKKAMPSISGQNATAQIVVVAEDPGSVQQLQEVQRETDIPFEILSVAAIGDASIANDVLAKSKVDAPLVRKSAVYNALMRRRPVYVQKMLERGTDVLLIDLDAVLMQDPFALLNDHYPDSDIVAADDSNVCKGEDPIGMGPGRNLCGGFIFFKATTGALATAIDWALLVSQQQGPNQVMLNVAIQHALDRGDTAVATFSPNQVAQGCWLHVYLDPSISAAGRRLLSNNSTEMVAVHANYLKGDTTKRELLRQAGLWYQE